MNKAEIRLRELKEQDVEGMLEWMHDEEIQKGFRKPMLTYTKKMAMEFIKKSKYEIKEGESIHFAITNSKDEYLGTISLKNLDLVSYSAEYAVVIRKGVQGKGYAKEATLKLLEKGFIDYGLERIYLNVLSENEKANELYKRCGFVYEGEARKAVAINGIFHSLKWYSMLKEEYIELFYN